MYIDSSNMVNDFMSDANYSPRARLTPVVTSPHYNEGDLSPRRMFTQSSSQSRLLPTYSLSIHLM